MRVICHISKKTARYLLKSGLVPCIDTGKKTRQYIINTKDVIAYLKAPIQPAKIYTPNRLLLGKLEQGSPRKTLTLREWANLDTAKDKDKFAAFLKCKMRLYSDVLSATEVSKFTGYHHNTITTWCSNGYFRYFKIGSSYMIPKVCILNYLVSPHVLDSYRPAQKMVALAKEFSQQGKPTEKAVHRYTPVNIWKQRPPNVIGGRCFCKFISTGDNLSPVRM